MEQFSVDCSRLELVRPQVMQMKKYFDMAKCFPKYLITQNKPVMKKAFAMVPAAIWSERIYDLQEALQLSHASDWQRRVIVTARSSGMTDTVDRALDVAFLDKYEELMEKVLYQFDDFFPYAVSRTNRDLFVFEKMDSSQLVQYVLSRTQA